MRVVQSKIAKINYKCKNYIIINKMENKKANIKNNKIHNTNENESQI